MELGCLIVYCTLLTQQSPRSLVPPARENAAATADPLVAIDQRKPKLTPPRIVSESLLPATHEPLVGRAIPLVEVLTRATTRPRQLAAVQAYWTLAAAVGDYHYVRLEHDALTTLAENAARARPPDKLETTALSADLALASARVREAELRVAAAQSDLAERAGLAANDRVPLPADEPHVGGYTTYFDLLFNTRPAPSRMQLLHRTLPLRFKAIDVRAEAVQAAVDSVDAAYEALNRREIDAEQVASRVMHLARQRKAFLDAVRQYNHEIAEYAMGVADPNAAPAAVLPMLVKPKKAAAPTATPERTNSAATPAAEEEDTAPRTGRAPAMRSLLKAEAPSDSADSQTRLKPAEGLELAQLAPQDADPTDHESYAALLSLSPPKRTHRLARLLHWDRSLADAAEPSLTLEQCLVAAPTGDRRRAVEAFWAAREQAARCQICSDQSDQLESLYPAALRAARRPGGAEAMLDLRARQQAAAAELLESQALLWERRMELAAAIGRGANAKDWPLPVTSPHGGRYETRLELQPTVLAQSPALRSLATALPGLYAALEDRAEAVVHLDAQRAEALEAFEAGHRRVEITDALEMIARQATESHAFLSTLTRYNLSIADYVFGILPPTTAPLELTSSLVVQTR